jgi:hypothetical protein
MPNNNNATLRLAWIFVKSDIFFVTQKTAQYCAHNRHIYAKDFSPVAFKDLKIEALQCMPVVCSKSLTVFVIKNEQTNSPLARFL